jgi:hypothetical protein
MCPFAQRSCAARRPSSAALGVSAAGDLEAGGHGAVAEQALSGAEHEREDLEPELVDEPVLEQGLDQVRAAVDLKLGAVLLLELANGVGDVARSASSSAIRVRSASSRRRAWSRC